MSMALPMSLILILCTSQFLTVYSRSCEFSNPNWTPIPNMVSALRGYNILTGNPLNNNADPGFVNQIFKPTKINARGDVELNSGITATELSNCQRNLNSKSFTTINSYRDFVSASSKSGYDLQVGMSTEVTAGIDIKGAKLSAKTTIPPAFTRAWGESSGFKELTSLFSTDKEMVSVAMGRCTLYEIKLVYFQLPPFTDHFIKSIGHLYNARKSSPTKRKALFKKFINEYGTHYLSRTQLGATFIHRTKYSQTARKTLDSEILKECNYKKGLKYFGIQLEEDASGCREEDERKIKSLGRESVIEEIITRGSRPTDIQKWVTQAFIPTPLRFQLSPIVNLLNNRSIDSKNMKYEGENVNSLEIRKWFLPLYYDYCNSMDLSCERPSGCGIDDKCPTDTICDGTGKTHSCTEWSSWTCTVECGQGTTQKRTRTCTGCNGKLKETRTMNCKPQKPCHKISSSNCVWHTGRWGQRMRCQYGYVATGTCGSGRDGDCGNNIWAKLKCCKIDVKTTPGACSTQNGKYGVNLNCPYGRIVNSYCGSGRDDDCGNQVWTSIGCCNFSNLKVASQCSWQYGRYGSHLYCPRDHAVTGACGSGSGADCPRNSYHGINCCKVN